METHPLFWKSSFFDFFCFKMPVCSRKHFWWKKIKSFLLKMSRFGAFFSEFLWYILIHRENVRKKPGTSSKTIFSEFSCVQKYKRSLKTCSLRNSRRVLLKVLSAESFFLNTATAIVRQLELHSINLKNFYLLFLVELRILNDIEFWQKTHPKSLTWD